MTSARPATPRVLCFGEVLWDVYGGERRLGGAPANVAFHAAACGARASLISCVGNDELGRNAVEILREGGVDTAYVSNSAAYATGCVQVTASPGGPSYVIQQPAAWDFIELSDDALDEASEVDVLCFGTLAQRAEVSRKTLFDLLDRVDPANALAVARRPLRVLDLNLRPPFIEPQVVIDSIQRADVVKLNEEEADWLAQQLGVGDSVSWLSSLPHMQLVALTRGAHGAVLRTPHETVAHPGFPSTGIDPVGAGDAFTACLAMGLAQHAALPEILAIACKRAAWVASEHGAMPTGR